MASRKNGGSRPLSRRRLLEFESSANGFLDRIECDIADGRATNILAATGDLRSLIANLLKDNEPAAADAQADVAADDLEVFE